MLRRVEEQPADSDSYIQTPYGIAAVRVDEVPAADEDEGLFGSPRATEPVSSDTHSLCYRNAPHACGIVLLSIAIPAHVSSDEIACRNQVNYQSGGKKPARLFSTSAMSREPAGCCMDDGFQRCFTPCPDVTGNDMTLDHPSSEPALRSCACTSGRCMDGCEPSYTLSDAAPHCTA